MTIRFICQIPSIFWHMVIQSTIKYPKVLLKFKISHRKLYWKLEPGILKIGGTQSLFLRILKFFHFQKIFISGDRTSKITHTDRKLNRKNFQNREIFEFKNWKKSNFASSLQTNQIMIINIWLNQVIEYQILQHTILFLRSNSTVFVCNRKNSIF